MHQKKRAALAADEGGQAMVEAAIVMPIYVFLILGLLQLGLMHQARLLTKYAAYRAARAGALNQARTASMEAAALGAVLPILSTSAGGDVHGAEIITPITDAASYAQKYAKFGILSAVGLSFMLDGVPLKYIEVMTCGPTKDELGSYKNREEVDFDDPTVATGSGRNTTGWKEANRTKLRIQATLNYRMPIPFANMVIHAMAMGREVTSTLRMGEGEPALLNLLTNFSIYNMAAQMGIYILPIRAEYAMRMQSNLLVDQLPESNACIIPFDKQS